MKLANQFPLQIELTNYPFPIKPNLQNPYKFERKRFEDWEFLKEKFERYKNFFTLLGMLLSKKTDKVGTLRKKFGCA